jgi:hypothetical protein
MKIVYNNPVLELTSEEMDVLNHASKILKTICDKIDDYSNCKHKCPIYNYCPHHVNDGRQIHNLLDNIVFEAGEEEE